MNKEEIKVMIKDCVYSEDRITYMSDKQYSNYINIIEQLQQENKKYKEENEFLKSEIEEAKRIFQKYLEYIDERDERIDKAIEYIEYNNKTLYTYEPNYDYEENIVDNYDISSFREDLLEILKEVE